MYVTAVTRTTRTLILGTVAAIFRARAALRMAGIVTTLKGGSRICDASKFHPKSLQLNQELYLSSRQNFVKAFKFQSTCMEI